jgi:hypothetical protein
MIFDTQSTCYLFYGLCTACGQAYKIREFPQKFKKGVGGGGVGRVRVVGDKFTGSKHSTVNLLLTFRDILLAKEGQ